MFIEETVIDERAIRRLATTKGCIVTRENCMWNYCNVVLDDDDIWSVLNDTMM